MTFCILMSAYNGEKYIEEQLDSIFSQEAPDVEIKVLIRDDGSADGTIEICENYAKDHNVDIQVIKGKNVGAAASFLELINDCPLYDYYAFCDQDDVWLPGKVLASTQKLNNEAPVMWASNYDVVDADRKVLQEHVLDQPETDPFRILFYNNVPGCVMVFNKALMQEMKKLELREFRMHDIFALNMAALFGTIIFEPQSYVLYRQHGDNALGFGNKKIKIRSWLGDKIKYLNSHEDYHFVDYSSKILDMDKSRLTSDQAKQFAVIQNYKAGLSSTIRLLRSEYTHDGINRTGISIRMKILLHRM